MGSLTKKQLEEINPDTPQFQWFFQKRYYLSRTIKLYEYLGFAFMLASIIFFNQSSWGFIGLYFLGLLYHVYYFYSIKHQIPKDES